MEIRTSRFEVPGLIPGLIVSLALAALAYVFAYGGNPSTPALLAFGAIGIALCLFVLYLFYRFIIAVETIAEKY